MLGEYRVIEPGLYEQLLTEALLSELETLDGSLRPDRPLHTAEAADRIALHLSRRRIRRTLDAVGDSDRVQVGIEVARDLIARLATIVDSELAEAPVEPGTVLHAILQRRPDGTRSRSPSRSSRCWTPPFDQRSRRTGAPAPTRRRDRLRG